MIEFVSPAQERGGRAGGIPGKWVAYLRKGVGLVIVDIVTEHPTDFHNLLLDALNSGPDGRLPTKSPTYVMGYRPVRRRSGGAEMEVWVNPAPLGEPIPAVPLGLRRGPVVTLDLEGTYSQALSDCNL